MHKEFVSVQNWVEYLLSRGKYCFSLQYLSESLPQFSQIAIKRALSRMSRNGKIVSIYKGFYLIISPQYSSRGILPVPLFLDALMKEIDRTYYLGLLNAAAHHGAAHQSPQEYFVITGYQIGRASCRERV